MTQTKLFDMRREAIIDGPYRYRLERTWATGRRVLWLMLNPSTADALKDDPTLRRVIAFTRSWGVDEANRFGGVIVANLFAWRSSTPDVLATVADPVGPRCDFEIIRAARESAQIICAWGNGGSFRERDRHVLSLLRASVPETPIRCLGSNVNGTPKHPLSRGRGFIPLNVGLELVPSPP